MEDSSNLMPVRIAHTTPWSSPLPPQHPVQRLPFEVRAARDERDLSRIVNLRKQTYGRHAPQVADSMVGIEAEDRCTSALVLLAECRQDRRILGTIRLHHNVRQPLPIEASINLPSELGGCHLVEATRLCIAQAAPPEVRWALFKASYYHCLDAGVHSLLATARRSLARIYEGLLFKDLTEPDAMYPMRHAGDLPHRALVFRISAAERLWQSHPMRAFMADTLHPDICR